MTIFETKTCTRCGGSGKHSWCQQWQDMCFNCRGNGKVLTPKGEAARSWFFGQQTVSASALAVGDCVAISGVVKVGYIESIEHKELSQSKKGDEWIPNMGYILTFRSSSRSCGICEETEVRILPKPDALKTLKAQALDYQSKLTKAGKLAKKHQNWVPA